METYLSKLLNEKILIELYIDKRLSQSKIAEILGVKQQAVAFYCKKYSIKSRNHSEANRKFSLNEDYFNKIDMEEKAYWLGFLYADGCIYKRTFKKGSIAYNTQLKLAELQHLEKYKNSLNCGIPIKHHYNIRNGIKYPHYYLYISSKKLFRDLEDKGLMERKTFKLEFPTEEQVPKHLIHHFIRGYFDGDGTVSTFKRSNTKNNITLSSGFVGRKDILEQFSKEILGKIKTISKKGNIYNLSFHKKDSYTFYKYLYYDATIMLDRKKEKFDNYFKQKGSETIISYPEISG